MTSNIKTMTERLRSGFKDYFLNIESFDGRYVCGQLFLYGKAKSVDVGIPGSYDGTDEVRVQYFLNWFNFNWHKTQKALAPIIKDVLSHDSFHDAKVVLLPSLKRAVNVEEYVQLIQGLTEALQYATINKVQIDEHVIILNELNSTAKAPVNVIKTIKRNDLSDYLVNMLKSCLIRLNNDYDGKQLYPTATLTYLSVVDQLYGDLHPITHPRAFDFLTVNGEFVITEELINNTFQDKQIKDLLSNQTFDVLILGLKNYKLLNQTVQHIQKAIDLANLNLSSLLKE